MLFWVTDDTENGGGDNTELRVFGGFRMEAIEPVDSLEYGVVVQDDDVLLRG